MLTRADFEVLAAKFRKLRPQKPKEVIPDSQAESEVYGESVEEYESKLSEWKFWRNQIADACAEINWRFNRQKFIDETER